MDERSKFVIDASRSASEVLDDCYALLIRQFAQALGVPSVENVEKVGALMANHLA